MLLQSALLLLFGICGLFLTAAVDTITLSNGASMPVLGLGSWQASNEAQFTEALKTAFDSGYRLVDTAYSYHNEHVVGKVLKEYIDGGKLKREDVFVMTKLPLGAHDPNDVEKCLDEQLKALQTDYVDLYLIHGPVPFQKESDSYMIQRINDKFIPVTIDHLDTYKAMERLYDAKKIKIKTSTLGMMAIGLANFNATQLQNVYDHARIKPTTLETESHLYWPQDELYDLCKRLNMSLTAHAPLGSPGRRAASPNLPWPDGEPLQDPVVKEIATKHSKTPAQILLRYLIQLGRVVIPKSTNPVHIKENINVFDFTLTDEEMTKLKEVKTRTRLFLWPFAFGHPFYPYGDIDHSKYTQPK